MVNNCQIIIVTGMYAGSICKNVHDKCPHRKNHKCKQCDFKTMDRDKFRQHLISHQKEKIADAKILKQPRAAQPTKSTDVDIIELPTNFYKFILENYGHDDGVNLIAAAATDGDPLRVLSAIIDKTSSGSEPIASYSGHFRFFKDGVLMDANLQVITRYISSKIQTAMIYASNELINQHRKTIDELYNVYDIGKIQGTIASFPADKVRKRISALTERQSHPFFKHGIYAKKLKEKS